jgi:AcrR family transcriptional regulator
MATASRSRLPRSKRPRREDVRTRILDAARTVFAKRGLQGASIEEIAETAGFSRGAFYSNFTDKEDLFLQLFQARDHVQLEEIEQLAQDTATSEDFWAGLRQRHVRRSATAREWFILSTELWLHAMRDPAFKRALATRYSILRESIAASLERHLPEIGAVIAFSDAASLVLALDEGLALQEQIDIRAFPEDLYVQALERLAGDATRLK